MLDLMIEQQERELAALRARLREQDEAIELLLGACGAISSLKSDEALAEAAERVRQLQAVRAAGMSSASYSDIRPAVEAERLWLAAQVPLPKNGPLSPSEYSLEWRGHGLDIDASAVFALFRGPDPIAAVSLIQRRAGEPVKALRWRAEP